MTVTKRVLRCNSQLMQRHHYFFLRFENDKKFNTALKEKRFMEVEPSQSQVKIFISVFTNS
jgi:hypothetical protein